MKIKFLLFILAGAFMGCSDDDGSALINGNSFNAQLVQDTLQSFARPCTSTDQCIVITVNYTGCAISWAGILEVNQEAAITYLDEVAEAYQEYLRQNGLDSLCVESLAPCNLEFECDDPMPEAICAGNQCEVEFLTFQ